MPVGRIVRHSPWYLYAKLYGLSCLVSIFASRPVTGRVEALARSAADRQQDDRHLQRLGNPASLATIALAEQIRRIQIAAEDAISRGRKLSENAPIQSTASDRRVMSHSPYALKTLASDADAKTISLVDPPRGVGIATRLLRRWGRRFGDMRQVRRQVAEDFRDVKRSKELLHDAKVRLSQSASEGEISFLQERANRIAQNKALLMSVGVDLEDNPICAKDIPTVGVGGSGGGYRAAFGFLGAVQGLERAGLYDSVFWIAGVSGSCWTIAALYSMARLNTAELERHYKSVASEDLHPMSRRALDTVARSRKGVYFLLGPHLAKLQSGNVGIGIMDMYATLTSSYQLLSRSPHARPRLSRSTFQFSRLWDRAELRSGKHPLPILTAVRRPASLTVKHSVDRVVGNNRENKKTKAPSTALQWWEVNPVEVGSADEGAWVPTWAYGRPFVSGRSVVRSPEISLAMLLGQVTSAPAGPLTGYITTLLASIPRDTIMSRLLSRLNTFVLHKRWERRWGNPIRGADEPNPLYGTGKRSMKADDDDSRSWEGRGRIKLMDSGMSNNLPNHIFTTSARQADIIMAFDMSSDVRSGSALDRLDAYAKERQVRLMRWSMSPDGALLADGDDQAATNRDETAESIRHEHRHKYAQIFCAWHARGDADAVGLLDREPHLQQKNLYDSNEPDYFIVYCPLLPNAVQPDFDPTTSTFSTSYNLIWTPEQVDTLLTTARANALEYAAPALRQVYKHMYEQKRRRRLAGKDVGNKQYP